MGHADDLRRSLADRLPPEVAEVLLPAMVFHDQPGGVRCEARNAAWLDAWRHLGAEAAEAWQLTQAPSPALTASAPGDAGTERSQATLDQFVADPGNQLALAACRRAVEAPGLEHNPLFLHGGAGTGKTHLLQAVAHEFVAMLGDGAVVALDGPTFVTTHAQELGRREESPLRSALATAVCITIDGLDALAGRDLAQEELFHLLNDALDRGAQVLIAGRLPPARLEGWTDRLTSRLSWGLVVGLEAAQLETRTALVRQRGGRAAQAMDPVALAALVEARAPDMHRAMALAEHLADHGAAPRAGVVSFDRILATVAERFDLRPGDLTGKRRDRDASQARGLALLLARRLTDHSLQALGGMVGGRDHATVLHALRSTEERIAADPEARRAYDDLARLVVA